MWKWLAGALVIVVAACTGSNFLEALNRSRQRRTMADMRSIATALEALATDRKAFSITPRRPVAADTLHSVTRAELERALVPVYIRKLPQLDGWGEPFRVYVGGYDAHGRAQQYLVRSFGSDRRADTAKYQYGTISRFDQDVVFSNGSFFRRPEGI